MTRDEIRNKVLFNEMKIKELLNPSIFILQPEVQVLEKEIAELQAQCKHEYVDGVCIVCGKAK